MLGQFAVMQGVVAGSGLIRNKIVAYRLGPVAFGEISQLAAVLSVAATAVSFGMAVSLSRNAARYSSVEDRRAQLANANGIVLTLAVAAVAGLTLFLASGRLLPIAGLSSSPAIVLATVVLVAGIPFDALKNNYLAFLQGILDARGLALGRSIGVLVATIVAIPVVWFLGFVGAAIQVLLLSAAVAILLGVRCRSIGYSPLRTRLDARTAASLASFGVVSMASTFAQGLADAAVRKGLIVTAGAGANGLLQAPYVLSLTLKGVVLVSIGSVSLATIAARRDRAEVSATVAQLLNVVVPVGASALALLGLLGAPVLTLLYSSAFVGGATFFPYLLSADLLLVVVWVVGAPLLAFGDRILWLALELIYAAARWALAVVLLGRLGATAVVVGYLAAVALHLVLNLALFRFRYGLSLERHQLGRVGVGLALVAGLSIAGMAPARPAHLLLAAVAVWFAYTLHHARRSQIVPALRRSLQRK